MLLSRSKKNNVYPCKPQFYYMKVGFKVVKIIYVFLMFGGLVQIPGLFGDTFEDNLFKMSNLVLWENKKKSL